MPDKKAWSAGNIPDLSGKTIVVTGGNSGIGYEAALEFARNSAKVILACRDLGKARTAAAQILASSPNADVEVMALDLSSLASIRSFADAFHLQHQSLHVLCNNAGVMAIPYRTTADGFEMQFGTNLLAQSAAMGALPTEYAAVAPEVHGGDYIGPDGFAEQKGHPKKVGCSAAARDASSAKRLWEVSEQLTGVHYVALPG